MLSNIDAYYARRADEEDELATASTNPLVKAVHERFAAAYRAQGATGVSHLTSALTIETIDTRGVSKATFDDQLGTGAVATLLRPHMDSAFDLNQLMAD